MSTTILTRWKLLLNLSEARLADLPRLFNADTGRSFIRALGGRSTIRFAPVTLTCITRFYDLLRGTSQHLGFAGRKLPLEHAELGLRINLRFRLYGDVLVVEVERSAVEILPHQDLLIATQLNEQEAIFRLAMAVIGMIERPETDFTPAAQLPKTFHCSRIITDDFSQLERGQLVELLTRHRMASDIVVASVLERNRMLQSDATTLLIDRQGVLAAIPLPIASDVTVWRRFDAACNMFEVTACVQRLLERGSIGKLGNESLDDLCFYFQSPQQRFLYSTSSLLIWRRIAAEFDLIPERWQSLCSGIKRGPE